MEKPKKNQQFVANELSVAEIEKLLLKISRLIKSARKERTTLENFAYEIRISRSQMNKYEAGGDMFLSTFLKLLHGLDMTLVEFFNELQKNG